MTKVNVSINPETMAALKKLQVSLSGELGFRPSYSQVIQHILKLNEVPVKQTDNGVEMLTNEGDGNE